MTNNYKIFPVRKSFDTKKNKWRKHPAVPKGVSWADYDATDEELSHAANVGCVIPHGRCAIDLDTHKGVTREMVDKVLGEPLDWDGSHIQDTVSGGSHHIFKLPAGVVLRQQENVLGVQGFDTRAAGKGWLCTGEGYTDHTLLGMPEALFDEDFPELPSHVVEKINQVAIDDDFDDLEQAVNNLPIDGITISIAREYMKKLPKADLKTYSDWTKPGFALHHQFSGTPDEAEALQLWKEWSQLAGDDYDEEEIDDKWPTFGNREHISKPTRFDYIIHRAGGRSVEQVIAAQTLMDKAKAVETLDDYETLKREVAKTSKLALADDGRQMIAKAIYDTFAKKQGITLSGVRNALKPSKKQQLADFNKQSNDVSERGGIFSDWVYVETACEFRNTALYYGIKQEAFNAKFNRLPDVSMAEKTAASYALTECNLPTVVDTMFWPGADVMFEHENKTMLNTYNNNGVAPCESLDDEGKAAIKLFLDHLAFVVTDVKEQIIILDWMTYVYQNPGKRISWALLIQGSQGSGKSYLAAAMQAIMGQLVTNLDPTAIAGRFTGWAHGSQVVVVEEIRISGTNKYEVLDRMKPFISNDTVPIEEKGRDHRTVPNFTSYMMLTNHKDAIPLTTGDRRYCVIYGNVQSEEQLYRELGGEDGVEEYFSALFNTLRERPDALAHFFAERQVSEGFKPRGRAPKTRAKELMTQLAVSPDQMMIEDAISQCSCDVINDDVIDVTWLNDLCKTEGIELPKPRTVSAILLDMGYQQMDGRKLKISKTRRNHYVWIRTNIGAQTEITKIIQKVKEFHEDEDYVPF